MSGHCQKAEFALDAWAIALQIVGKYATGMSEHLPNLRLEYAL
jgi:hypothetical protein